jgi:hypothetical protein
MAKIPHEVLFRFAWILQFLDWVRHYCCCRRAKVVCYGVAQTWVMKYRLQKWEAMFSDGFRPLEMMDV